MSNLTEEYQGIYGWSVADDGRCKPPKQHFPEAIRDRIKWAMENVDNGLTYEGALEAVLATDEERAKADFELGGEWLPLTDEARSWLKHPIFGRVRQMQIALALLYGLDDEENGK